MRRIGFAVGMLAVALCVAGLVYQSIDSPVAAQRAWLDNELANLKTDPVVYHTRRELPYDALQKAIAARPSLVEQVIKAPVKEAPAPNVKAMLAGVKATRVTVGSGDAARIRIMSKDAPRGALLGIGDTVNGLSITAITPTEVTFTLEQDGKTYTATLPRER